MRAERGGGVHFDAEVFCLSAFLFVYADSWFGEQSWRDLAGFTEYLVYLPTADLGSNLGGDLAGFAQYIGCWQIIVRRVFFVLATDMAELFVRGKMPWVAYF